jgi:transcriptional regulator with XRE-family HTH domain
MKTKSQKRTPLERWLNSQDVSQAELARTLGVPRQLVHRWVSGIATPGKRNARRIADLSGRALTEMDLMFPDMSGYGL